MKIFIDDENQISKLDNKVKKLIARFMFIKCMFCIFFKILSSN